MRSILLALAAAWMSVAGAQELKPWTGGAAPALVLEDLEGRSHSLESYRGKVVLEEPPGKLALSDPKVVAARKRLFGGWEMNYLAYNMGHDVQLPHATRRTQLPYLMYTNAEADGELRDQLDPASLRYEITAREVTS